MYKSKCWQHETTGTDGNTELFGVNIFDYAWHDTKEKAFVNEKEITIYSVIINNEKRLFAAIEVSNCVWAFYTYKY